jgi:hypothetical protein
MSGIATRFYLFFYLIPWVKTQGYYIGHRYAILFVFLSHFLGLKPKATISDIATRFYLFFYLISLG